MQHKACWTLHTNLRAEKFNIIANRGRQQIPESPGSQGFPGLGLGFGIHLRKIRDLGSRDPKLPTPDC